jgi:von Willebrand factor type A domain
MAWCMLLCCLQTTAQKRTRILFLMDASSSMTYSWQENQNRFQAGAKVVNAIIDSMYAINNEVEFAVRIYGDQFESAAKNCTDTRLIVPFNLQNLYQIKNKLKYIQPLGSSPIAYSLQQASENELNNTDMYDYSFVLVTDGGESCGGDICDMYKKMVANKIKVAPYIIGLDTNRLLQNYYQCLGQFVAVTTPADIGKAAKLIVDNNRPLLLKPKTLNIVTKPDPPIAVVEPPVKKVEPPVKLDIIVPPIKDELAKMPNMQPKLIIVVEKPIKKWSKYLQPAKLPIAFVVTTAPQLDAMQAINSIAIAKPINNFTREFKVQKPRKLGAAQLPEAFIAEKINEGFLMQKLNIDLAINPLNIAVKNILGIGKTVAKAKLPMAITEKEFEPIEMTALNNSKMKSIPIFKNNNLIAAKNFNYKLLLPEEITEKEFVPIAMELLAKARPNAVVASTAEKIVQTRRSTTYQLPPQLFIPEFIPKMMEQIFAAQFRITNISNINYLKMPEQLAKRNSIKYDIPKGIAVVKKEIVPPIATDKTEFTLQTEPSADTRIAVYFTDGFGKFYNAKPMVALQDVATKKSVKTFMRDVLANGDPEPVKLVF